MSCLFYWLCDVYEVLIDGSCLDMPSREVSTLEQGKESYRLWSPRSSRRPCLSAARGLKRNEIARSLVPRFAVAEVALPCLASRTEQGFACQPRQVPALFFFLSLSEYSSGQDMEDTFPVREICLGGWH